MWAALVLYRSSLASDAEQWGLYVSTPTGSGEVTGEIKAVDQKV